MMKNIVITIGLILSLIILGFGVKNLMDRSSERDSISRIGVEWDVRSIKGLPDNFGEKVMEQYLSQGGKDHFDKGGDMGLLFDKDLQEEFLGEYFELDIEEVSDNKSINLPRIGNMWHYSQYFYMFYIEQETELSYVINLNTKVVEDGKAFSIYNDQGEMVLEVNYGKVSLQGEIKLETGAYYVFTQPLEKDPFDLNYQLEFVQEY